MDKNIAALIREDTKTVGVKFFPDVTVVTNKTSYMLDAPDMDRHQRQTAGKEYTYVTTLNLKLGDLCLVFVGERPAVVEVTRVDETIAIEPNAPREYKWIASVFDTVYYEKLMEQNKEVMALLSNRYQQNIRQQFKQAFLAGADEGTIKLLDEILTK